MNVMLSWNLIASTGIGLLADNRIDGQPRNDNRLFSLSSLGKSNYAAHQIAMEYLVGSYVVSNFSPAGGSRSI